MNLPNAHLAIVESDKILGYLLDPNHRYGASKARFFASFGFQRNDWQQLAHALREHGNQHPVLEVKNTGSARVTS